MSIGVVVFPGSNCDRDVQWATEGCLGMPTRRLWHEDTDLSGLEAVVLPTCPNRLLVLSQNILSKQSTTLLRFPYPSLCTASFFQSGSGGLKVTVLGLEVVLEMLCFSTPRGNVQRTQSVL